MALEGMGSRTGSGTRTRGSGGSFGTPSRSLGSSLASNKSLVAAAPTSAPPAPASPSYGGDTGGYGGGGGIGSYAAPAPRPRMSLADVIANDFGYNARRAENDRLLRDFDAESTRLRGETERDQAVRRDELSEDVDRSSVENAEDMAGRGLLRSGGTFVNQQRINDDATRRGTLIDQLLTDLLSNRAQGRLTQEARNREALNTVQQQIANRYASDPNLGIL